MTIPFAVLFIVAVEFCERLCYFTFSGTQKVWLQDQGFSNAQSSSINLSFAMVSYVSCFFGGWLASTRVGRFRTVMVLASVYAFGTYLSGFASLPGQESVPLYLFGTMVLVTLGSGGIKPNVVTIGADQIDPADPDYRTSVKSFFQYFYLAINLGSIISHGFLSSTAVSGLPVAGISIEYGFFFSYMVAASFMLLAVIAFVAGKRWYREGGALDDNGVLSSFFGALREGSGTTKGKIAIVGWALVPGIIVASLANAFMSSDVMKTVCLVMDCACLVCLVVAHLDNSWLPPSGIRQCMDCVPVLLVGNIFYGILDSSIGSFFQSQACQMDTRWDRHDKGSFQFSGDSFRLANPLAIIIWTPFLVRCVYPFVERCIGRGVSTGMKVTAGYVFAIASQLTASCLERARLAAPVTDLESRCAPMLPDGTHIRASDMSAVWMMLPYALAGMGEISVYPVLQAVAYEGSPPEMRSLMLAFTYFAMGALPNAMASGVSQALSSLVPNDLNKGDLGFVYIINCGIGVFGLLVFWLVWKLAPKRLRLSEDAEQEKEDEEEDANSSTNSSDDDSDSA